MNLNYTLSQITKIVKGKLYGNATQVIQNIIIDSRSPLINENSLFVTLNGQKVNGIDFITEFNHKQGQTVLVNQHLPQFDCNQIVVKNTLNALQLIAQYHRQQFNIPIIGITGSNGKTTVKEWLFHALKSEFTICRSPKSYNSQLGVALSVLALNKNHTLGIFEAGISQSGEMEVLQQIIQPTIGVYTGIGDAHQTNFKSLAQKEKEKQILFKSVSHLIQNNTDLLNLEIPFTDKASLQNANLVYETAIHLGVDQNKIKNALKTLPSISMRMEKMQGKNGNLIINDAYSLDEKSLEIGINYLNQISKNKQKILIIGSHKNSHFSNQMVNTLNALSDIDVILIGGSNSFLSQVKLQFKSVDDFLSADFKYKETVVLVTGSRDTHLEKIIPYLTSKNHITRLKIDLSSLRHNLNFYKSKLKPTTEILAMVKAQSYGGGIVEMAQFLESEKVNYFGVAYADEGVTLRQNGIKLPILVMNPEPNAFDDIINHNLEPSIYSLAILDQFIGTLIRRNKTNFPIHLKIDTGMNRLGFVSSQIDELIAQLKAQPEVYVKSVFSHLSVADNQNESEFTHQQINGLKMISKRLKNDLGYDFKTHIANSAAAIHYTDAHFEMVRLGIGLFGLLDENNQDLETVLTFETKISQIKQIKKGDSVGYGRAFKSENNMTIAIIPVGYADGLRRSLSQGNWSVEIDGKLYPIIGNICMDMCMIDITNSKYETGDSVIIFGTQNTVFQMAKTLNTIPYEIISLISSRVHRVYLEE